MLSIPKTRYNPEWQWVSCGTGGSLGSATRAAAVVGSRRGKAYDGTGRRISKAVTNSGDWDWTYHFYLDGQSVIETRDSSSNTISQHLWGAQYIDELIETRLNDDPAFPQRP